MSKIKELYKKHVALTYPNHCALATFKLRIYGSCYYNRTEEEIINRPKKNINEKYKKHVEIHGDKAVTYNAFGDRIRKRGSVEKAIETPNKKSR